MPNNRSAGFSPNLSVPIAASPAPIAERFDRLAVGLLIVGGIVAALHVGKGPIAIPQMQHDFGLGLSRLHWVMSVFAIIGVIGGMATGVLAQRCGDRRIVLAGLMVLGMASLAGSMAGSYRGLIGSRVLEGLGFVLVVVATPAALNRLTPASRRAMVFGCWGTFMGIGIGLSMLLGPLLESWRRLWQVDGALALILALAIALRVDRATTLKGPAAASLPADLKEVWRSASGWLLACAFAAYNLQFFAMMSFLPSFLIQRIGLSVARAGLASAGIVMANIGGNLLAGVWLQRGLRPSSLMLLSCVGTGLLGWLIYAPWTPAAAIIALAALFSAVAGMLPVTFLACGPASAPEPRLVPMSLGLIMQGNYLGQVLAPLLVASLLRWHGWSMVGWQIITAAALGIFLALAYQRASAR